MPRQAGIQHATYFAAYRKQRGGFTAGRRRLPNEARPAAGGGRQRCKRRLKKTVLRCARLLHQQALAQKQRGLVAAIADKPDGRAGDWLRRYASAGCSGAACWHKDDRWLCLSWRLQALLNGGRRVVFSAESVAGAIPVYSISRLG
jgi:hypothetical protein